MNRFALCALLLVNACGEAVDSPSTTSCATSVFYSDDDGDGFGDPDREVERCERPAGTSEVAGDCDAGDDAVNPDAPEVCDGADNDCDGLVDAADPDLPAASVRTYYRDADGDGSGKASDTKRACTPPAGYVAQDGDCNDADRAVNPSASEVCDEKDDDCDGLVDDDDPDVDLAGASPYYADADYDGFGAGAAVVACAKPYGYATVAGDCDDGAAAVKPGAPELCDGLDNDCDGSADPAACSGLAGNYAGTYTISAVEKVGSTVVNNMTCNGTSAIIISTTQSPAFQGTVVCTRVGGLIAFDAQQSGTLEGDIAADGSVTGTLTHDYSYSLVRSYPFTATVSGGSVTGSGTGSLLPNAMSAVPWQVTFSFSGN